MDQADASPLNISTIHRAMGIASTESENPPPIVKIETPPDSFYTELEQKEQKVFKKYKELIAELTREEELEALGMSMKQMFPPLERDVEKLVVDLNVTIFKYMQFKMENDADIRVETIRSTVQAALRSVSAAVLTLMAGNAPR